VSLVPLRLSELDALLVDLGNVLVRLHIGRFLRRLHEVAPDAARAGREVFFAEAAYHRFARGEIHALEFHAAVEAQLGRPWPFAAFVEAWCDVFSENDASVAAVRRMRAVRPVYLLSNTDELHWGAIRGRSAWCAEFSGLHLSFEIGLEKPDPRFFTGFLERQGLCAGRCLFVDDLAENVAAARAVGIPAVRHERPDTLQHVVAELLAPSPA
jgi:FMN phosphatase YigB (HAD superfamily)